MAGEKDREDPRYDFAAVLDAAPPDIENEIAPQKMQERYDACQSGIQMIRRVMAEATVDVIIVISNPLGVRTPMICNRRK
ncbi:MAG: hypothetical protein O3B65_03715 [Chloroflexi bacterium]|nr:hypothetical protein [Chloroflexota bacterium]